MIWLLDANVLIAVSDEAHEHHKLAASWLAKTPSIATCPITEGALVRYQVRMGQATSVIKRILTDIVARPGYEFWPDTIAYADADLTQVIGHRQVTDAYLVSLVRQHGPDARLATLDAGLAQMYPDVSTLISLTETSV